MSQSELLHPDVIVDIFRHGHAAASDDDFSRKLSPDGEQQARDLGATIHDIPYEYIVCSSAPRAQETARLAMNGRMLKSQQFNGTPDSRQLYCPKSDDDYAAIIAMSKELGAASYGTYLDHDVFGLFNRFKEESLDVMSGISGLAEIRRIVIFNHAVMGNALAEALFPQHAVVLREINLAPCDGIRLTAKTCEHFPLL